MKTYRSARLVLALAGAVFGSVVMPASVQQPAALAQASPGASGPGGAGAGGGRGRGGLPGATPEQTQAVADMNAALAALSSAVATARTELASATYVDVKNEAGIRAAVEKLRVAELALASKRAEEFAKLQAGPNKLTPEQVTALIAAGGSLPAAGRGGRGGPGADAAGPALGRGGPGTSAGRG